MAIESALGQTYSPIEVVVVDDGSTDESREIIAQFGNNIVPVLKNNGGQASSLNAGVIACHGEIISFLDADDFFFPNKVAAVVDVFCLQDYRSQPMLVHHPVEIVDEMSGKLSGRSYGPKRHKSPLNLYEYAKRYRYVYYAAGLTSGMSVNRILAKLIFPLPEKGVALYADDFVAKAASLIGELWELDQMLTGYRLHGSNHSYLTEHRMNQERVAILDSYLNRLLVDQNLDPVISYYKSMYSWRELARQGRWSELVAQIVRTTLVRPNFHTLGYSLWFVYFWSRRAAGRVIKRSIVR
jgi:glycosyltransferase involved in cell wall biosynthesis